MNIALHVKLPVPLERPVMATCCGGFRTSAIDGLRLRPPRHPRVSASPDKETTNVDAGPPPSSRNTSASVAERFRKAQEYKRKQSTPARTASNPAAGLPSARPGQSAEQAAAQAAPNLRQQPENTLSDIWQARPPEDSATPSRSAAADQALLDAITATRAARDERAAPADPQNSSSPTDTRTPASTGPAPTTNAPRELPPSTEATGRAADLLSNLGNTSQASSGSKSFLDALNTAGGVRPAPRQAAPTRAGFARSEDEEIRASRQERLAAMGLVGSSSEWGSEEEARAAAAGEADVAERPVAAAISDGGLEGMLKAQRRDSRSADNSTSAGLSAEQFTLQKEEQARARGAKVISVKRDYQPTVSTWGVFERPRDISKTYGGGRNLKPGDSVMSDEEQAAYDKALKEKVEQFRRKAGIVADPVKVARCEELTAQGKILFDRGDLVGALPIFTEAAELVTYKSVAGGNALLQKALTLDSLGQNDEARSLYSKLRNHRSLYVAKTAKTMAFGFKAGAFLKADQISYAPKKAEYDPYFSRLNGKWGWDTVYVATEEDKEANTVGNRVLTAAVTALMFSPFIVLFSAVAK